MKYICPVSLKIPMAPYIKPKGFLSLLMPVVLKGIPAYADSALNPKVLGTFEHAEYWNNELAKIHQGFWIGDIWIPGRFYYYMNYKLMSTIVGTITPDMVDMHLELAYHIEYCLANGKNLLCAKGRRKGISEAVSTMLVDYGWRFTYGFKAGVAAGLKDYTEGFVEKWRFSDSKMPLELSVKKSVNNDDEIVSGYSIKDQNGAYQDQGTFNVIYARTANINANIYKGLYLNVVVSEEIGEHEDWIEFYGATKDCLMAGSEQKGILVAFGTAGNVNKGSKDFKKIWAKPDAYNFVKFMIPADRFNLYGGARNSYQDIPRKSALFLKYKDYQLVGVEDRENSLKNILEKRERMLAAGDMVAYNEDLQNNPINEQEMFRKTISNNFDLNKLNDQQHAVDNLSHPKYTKYKLEWVKDKNGMIKMPLEVTAVALTKHDDQNECICIIDSEHPRRGFSHLYTGGLDSFDQDQAKESKSLGAMSIRIRANNINGAMKSAPVAVISCRPRRKELFYELCLKAAVYYNLIENVLVDVGAALVMQYFLENGGWKYLADRPKKFESESSQQTHEKGVRFTTFSRPRGASLAQTDILDNGHEYWFGQSGDPCDLINQLGNYDIVEVGSDNDLADAHILSLMQDVSFEVKPRDNESNDVPNRYDLPKFVSDGNGGMKLANQNTTLKNIQQDSDLFGMMFGKID